MSRATAETYQKLKVRLPSAYRHIIARKTGASCIPLSLRCDVRSPYVLSNSPDPGRPSDALRRSATLVNAGKTSQNTIEALQVGLIF